MGNERVIISHCGRSGVGGEDIAINSIEKQVSVVAVNRKPYEKNKLIAVTKFVFGLEYFRFVSKNRHKHHIIVNYFPSASLLSLLLLTVFKVKLRLYIHNFSLSCPSGTHFRSSSACFDCRKGALKYSPKCEESMVWYFFHTVTNRIFLSLFLASKRNKVYLVSAYQKQCAIEYGIPASKMIIVGNIK